MRGNKSSSQSSTSNQQHSVRNPKPISIAPSRNIRSGERPAYQAPIPPKKTK